MDQDRRLFVLSMGQIVDIVQAEFMMAIRGNDAVAPVLLPAED